MRVGRRDSSAWHGGWRCPAAVAGLLLLALAAPLAAGTVILKIVATNPIKTPQVVKIHSNLPPRVRTNDVINLDGLELGYDVKNDQYYVHQEVELGPMQTVSYDIEINDIWVIPPDELDLLEAHSRKLAEQVKDTEYYEVARGTRDQIVADLKKIRKRQADNAINRVSSPIRHIRAFEANQEALRSVKVRVGTLENLVLGTKQDIGQFLGEVEAPAQPKRMPEIPPDEYGTAVMRITVENPSPDLPREIDYFKRELPSELGIGDVLDPGDLEVGVDKEKGSVYVYTRDLVLDPGETRTFEVTIRDKWKLNERRVKALRTSIQDVLERMTEKDKYTSVVDTLEGCLAELDEIEAQTGPERLSPEYVAFYREQGNRLDVVENQFNRVESILARMMRRETIGVGQIKPPDRKTTWLVIWIILGFLAFVSLVFFFRWYGRTKSENMEQ